MAMRKSNSRNNANSDANTSKTTTTTGRNSQFLIGLLLANLALFIYNATYSYSSINKLEIPSPSITPTTKVVGDEANSNEVKGHTTTTTTTIQSYQEEIDSLKLYISNLSSRNKELETLIQQQREGEGEEEEEKQRITTTDNDALANSIPNSNTIHPIYNTSDIICGIITTHKYHKTRAKAVMETWGKRCGTLLFFSATGDDELPLVVLPGTEEGSIINEKVFGMFKYVWKNYPEKVIQLYISIYYQFYGHHSYLL